MKNKLKLALNYFLELIPFKYTSLTLISRKSFNSKIISFSSFFSINLFFLRFNLYKTLLLEKSLNLYSRLKQLTFEDFIIIFVTCKS